MFSWWLSTRKLTCNLFGVLRLKRMMPAVGSAVYYLTLLALYAATISVMFTSSESIWMWSGGLNKSGEYSYLRVPLCHCYLHQCRVKSRREDSYSWVVGCTSFWTALSAPFGSTTDSASGTKNGLFICRLIAVLNLDTACAKLKIWLTSSHSMVIIPVVLHGEKDWIIGFIRYSQRGSWDFCPHFLTLFWKSHYNLQRMNFSLSALVTDRDRAIAKLPKVLVSWLIEV